MDICAIGKEATLPNENGALYVHDVLKEAQWPIVYGVGLRIKWSSVRIGGSVQKNIFVHYPLVRIPAVAAALSPWTRLFTPIVPR